jgi:branched-chain amino acid transport system ATP-binding protein
MRGETMTNIWVADGPRDISATWPRINVDGLSKSIGHQAVICNLDFFIAESEIVGLVGLHRSAVLDLLAGETVPTFGRITFNGADVTKLGADARRKSGIVRVLRPMELCSDMTALEHISLRTSLCATPFYPRRGGMNHRDAASAMLDSVGIADHRDVPVARLSAYEQCLLSLAIALEAKPSLLLLDGPGDELTRVEQLRLGLRLDDLRHDRGMSILIAEQDMFSPLPFCDRTLVLRRGKIIADDVPWKVAEYLESRRGERAAVSFPGS